mgnify:CR=1 FL=1
MITTPFLRAQDDMQTLIEALLRDSSNERWTALEVYQAINRALLSWWDRVKIPHMYSMPDGWDSQTYEYTLPSYIRPPLQPQLQRTMPVHYPTIVDSTTTSTWVDINAYEVHPATDGTLELQLEQLPYNEPGRIIWWGRQGPVPAISTLPALNANIDADDTSLVLDTAALEVEDAGYVKIDEEWIAYAGLTRGATTTTLSNLLRGMYDTTATSHTSSTTVYWGIAADSVGLFGQLQDQTMFHLHELFMTDASARERSHHGVMMKLYMDKADNFWKTYAGNVDRSPRLILQRTRMPGY